MTLVLAVLIGFLYGFKEGVISGLILGLIRDCLSAPVIAGSDGAVKISFGIGILLLFFAGVYGAVFFEGRTNRNLLLGVLAVLTFTVIYKVVGHLTVFSLNMLFSSYKVPFDIGDVLFMIPWQRYERIVGIPLLWQGYQACRCLSVASPPWHILLVWLFGNFASRNP